MIDERRFAEFIRKECRAICCRYPLGGHSRGDRWVIGDIEIDLRPDTAGEWFNFSTCEEGTLPRLLMQTLQVDLPGLAVLLERDFGISLRIPDSSRQAALAVGSKPEVKASEVQPPRGNLESDNAGLSWLQPSKESVCSRDTLQPAGAPLGFVMSSPDAGLPDEPENNNSTAREEEQPIGKRLESARPGSDLGNAADGLQPISNANQDLQEAKLVLDREQNLGTAYLSERGIRLETALAHGLEIDLSINRARIIERLGGDIKVEDIPLSCFAKGLIWFPIKDVAEGAGSWIVRVLPTPEIGPKFLTPIGGNAPPFVGNSTHKRGAKTGIPLIITEGPVKALSCIQAGVEAIGLNGVWCAAEKGPEHNLSLRKELREFDLRGRTVYVCFDADSATNPDVRHASIRLFFLLSAQGSDVYQLTSWDLVEGKGIDDYLVRQSTGQDAPEPPQILKMLMEDAAPFGATITKRKVDLDAVIAELGKVDLAPLYRRQFCKTLAKQLDVPVAMLAQVGRAESEKARNTVAFAPDPDPWPEAVSGPQLLNDLSCVLSNHVVLGDNSVVAVSLWVLLSYLTELVDTLAVLAITSPEKRCGKTKLLNVLYRLVRKPLASISISPAALYRVIEKFHPTLLVDEADTFLKNNDELRGVINGGHTRTEAFVLRANREDGEIEQFSTWAPKAIALIGRLHSTLHDRSLVIKMVRRTRKESITPLRDTPAEVFDKVRSQIVRWVIDNAKTIAAAKPDVPSELNDRAAENWLPLLAIAEAAGDGWPALARKAAISLSASDNDEDSVVTALLAAVRRIFQEAGQANEDKGFLPTEDILTALNADREAPWADWRRGDGISAEKLGRMLKPFGVKSAQIQRDHIRDRGYIFGLLKPVFERYLTPESPAT